MEQHEIDSAAMGEEMEELTFDVLTGPDRIRKGQIRYCNLNKFEDADNSISIGKNRPAIIFQNVKFKGKRKLSICIIPLSSSDLYSTDIGCKLTINLHDPVIGDKKSYVGDNRPVFIAVERIGSYIGKCPKDLIKILNKVFIERLSLEEDEDDDEEEDDYEFIR